MAQQFQIGDIVRVYNVKDETGAPKTDHFNNPDQGNYEAVVVHVFGDEPHQTTCIVSPWFEDGPLTAATSRMAIAATAFRKTRTYNRTADSENLILIHPSPWRTAITNDSTVPFVGKPAPELGITEDVYAVKWTKDGILINDVSLFSPHVPRLEFTTF